MNSARSNAAASTRPWTTFRLVFLPNAKRAGYSLFRSRARKGVAPAVASSTALRRRLPA